MARFDAAAVRAALADPRAVARALGLEEGARREGVSGLVVRCPAHGDRTPSLSLQVRGGTLSARCWACGWGGDLLALVAEVEGLDVRGDFGRVLARAAELAGGAVRNPQTDLGHSRPEAPRLPEALAAELFARVCKAGALRRRGQVESYLDRRGLLEAARADGWATLPSLSILLDCAREVWEATGCGPGVPQPGSEPSGQVSGGFAFCESRRALATAPESIRDGGPAREPSTILSPEDLLVAARLARWDRHGELRPLWGRHRLVIPWRGRGGRIQALQRRLVDAPRRGRDRREEPRYVLTWAPREPYGVDALDGAGAAWQERRSPNAKGIHTAETLALGEGAQTPWRQEAPGQPGASAFLPVIFVEGAVDVLSMRCLRPERVVALGLPGTGAWVSAWTGLVGERRVYWGLDADDAGDKRSAFGAIDVAEVQGRLDEGGARATRRLLADRLGALAQIKRDEEQGRITGDVAAGRRAALGAARCVLCGCEAPLLCRGCGRVRPKAKDWGKVWEGVRRRG